MATASSPAANNLASASAVASTDTSDTNALQTCQGQEGEGEGNQLTSTPEQAADGGAKPEGLGELEVGTAVARQQTTSVEPIDQEAAQPLADPGSKRDLAEDANETDGPASKKMKTEHSEGILTASVATQPAEGGAAPLTDVSQEAAQQDAVMAATEPSTTPTSSKEQEEDGLNEGDQKVTEGPEVQQQAAPQTGTFPEQPAADAETQASATAPAEDGAVVAPSGENKPQDMQPSADVKDHSDYGQLTAAIAAQIFPANEAADAAKPETAKPETANEAADAAATTSANPEASQAVTNGDAKIGVGVPVTTTTTPTIMSVSEIDKPPTEAKTNTEEDKRVVDAPVATVAAVGGTVPVSETDASEDTKMAVDAAPVVTAPTVGGTTVLVAETDNIAPAVVADAIDGAPAALPAVGDSAAEPAEDNKPAASILESDRPPPAPVPAATEGISYFGDNDVLSGRGGGTNVHPGNRTFRDLINMHRRAYLKARKNDKPAISRAIVRTIRESNGKFLKKDEKTGLWFEIGDDAAREKTSQALRQRAPEMRKLLFDTEREETRVAVPDNPLAGHRQQQMPQMAHPGMYMGMGGPAAAGMAAAMPTGVPPLGMMPPNAMNPAMMNPAMFMNPALFASMAAAANANNNKGGGNPMNVQPNQEAFQQMFNAAMLGNGMNRFQPPGKN